MTPIAAILDIDGTLADTNYQHAVAWYEAFRQQGITLPIWQVHRHIGIGGDKFIAAITDDETEERLGDALRAGHDALYLSQIANVSLFADARELISDLKGDGREVVLASSATAQEADHYLDLLDARDLADAWTTSDDVEASKPEPDLVNAALEKIAADAAVLVGDTPWDVEAAKKAGVDTIAVLTGGFSEAELRDAGAIAVYQSVTELREHRSDTPLG